MAIYVFIHIWLFTFWFTIFFLFIKKKIFFYHKPGTDKRQRNKTLYYIYHLHKIEFCFNKFTTKTINTITQWKSREKI